MPVKNLKKLLDIDPGSPCINYFYYKLSNSSLDLSLWDYTNYSNLPVNHNSTRTWNRLKNRLNDRFPSIVDIDLSEDINEFDESRRYFCRLNENSHYIYNLIEGIDPDVESIESKDLMSEEFMINTLSKMMNSEYYGNLLYDIIFKDNDIKLKKGLEDRLLSRFPNSIKDGKINPSFIMNIKGLFSY